MSVLTLAEAKTELNITVATDDTELQTKLDAAEAVIVTRCGPLVHTATTERVRGSRHALLLDERPVASLTSVTPVNGSALDVATLVVENARAGAVEKLDGGRFGSRWYDVVFQAGWAANAAALPKDLREAVLRLTFHLWAPQRGGGARPGSPMSPAASNTLPGAAYLLPFQVESLIAPFEKVEA